jgi:hypothetical protein
MSLNSSQFLFLSKLEYPVLQTGLSGFGNRICPDSRTLETLTGDVWPPGQTYPASQLFPELTNHIRPLAGFQRLTEHVRPPGSTYPASQPFPKLTKHIRPTRQIPETLTGQVRPQVRRNVFHCAFYENRIRPSQAWKIAHDVARVGCTRTHYVARRSQRMQKQNFGVTCPGVLFWKSHNTHPSKENSASTFCAPCVPKCTT